MSFTRYGRLYYFDPGPLAPTVGQKVLVPTVEGPEVAECVWPGEEVTEEIGALPVLVGLADQEALDRDERNRAFKARARVLIKGQVRRAGLPMKIIGIDWVDRLRTVTAFFSAEERVDFRSLVRSCARELDARVLFRQVSARDEARLQGGIGSCGRELCCSTFLRDFEPVTLRMAKDQDLPPNPMKISGACGRLMCCLKYEHPLYQSFHAQAPSAGEQVHTPAGSATVVGHNVPADTVVVRLDDTGRRCACPRASVCGSRQAYEAAHPGGGVG